jgi:hypothetical protein
MSSALQGQRSKLDASWCLLECYVMRFHSCIAPILELQLVAIALCPSRPQRVCAAGLRGGNEPIERS